MKSLLKFSVACALCAALVAPDALAFEPVPHRLNVQGVLRNLSGEVVTGTYSITFRLYTAETGGSQLYQENQVLTITGGVFSAYIGEVPESTFVNRSAAWLGIQVGADPELPRKQLTATGFAFTAEHAEKADELLGFAPDVQCSGCVDGSDVSILYALSDAKGGEALSVKCTGCVTGGSAPGSDIATGTIQNVNMGDNSINTAQIVDAAVTNAKLGVDAVKTGNIMNGQVMADDIADGAITTVKFAAGAVTNAALGVNYAGSDGKGAAANDIKCGPGSTLGVPCVDQNEVTFTFAQGKTQNGAAANLDCVDCVADTEVQFPYARSDIEKGAALDVKCNNATVGLRCVEADEVTFNYAASNAQGGPATDVFCTGCVGDTDIGVNYAKGVSKNGAAADVDCPGCVGATDVAFNYAASSSVAGPAIDLVCSAALGCVDISDIKDGSVVDSKVATGINGDKITIPTSTVRGTVRIGSGLTMDASGLVTPDFGTAALKVAEGNHVHSDYYVNPSTPAGDLNLAHGKKFNILDSGDYPPPSGPGNYAYFTQGTVGSSGTTSVRLVLGPDANPGKEWFEIYSDSSPGFIAHSFDASGASYHRGSVTLASGAQISCTGCVGSTAIGNNVVSTNIVDGSITGGDLNSNINITTGGTIKATGGMYAPRYYDSDDTSNTYYADPAQTSVMNQINYLVLSARGVPANANFMGLNGGVAYLDSISTDTTGNNLEIQNSRCGGVTMFGGSCTGNTLTVYGPMYADKLTDNAGGGVYVVDPEQTTTLRYLNVKTNDSWLGKSDGWNYLRGSTKAFNARWDDENGTYYLDPSATSKFKDFEVDWIKMPNRGGFPGNAVGYSQIVNSGGHLYLSPDNNDGMGGVIFNWAGDDKFYMQLNAARNNLARASLNTNGHYIFLNPSTSDPRIYLNYDVGGTTYVGAPGTGTMVANNLSDWGGSGCVTDPNGTSRQYEIYSTYLYSNYVRFGAMAANQIDLIGGGDAIISTGCVNQPCGHVGGSNAGFKSMWAQQFNTYSNRELKRDIKYFGERELAATMSEQLHNLKPATYFYKTEKNLGDTDASPSDIRTVPHYGMMIDEMPEALVSSEGGWSLGDSVGFLLVGAKYLEDQNREKDQKIKDLEDRVALMEQVLVDAGLIK